MNPSRKCPKCQSSMEDGFMLDWGEGMSKRAAEWIEGQPEKSFWTGVKIKDRRIFEVTVYRCERCGFLESYAEKVRE